MNRRASVLIVDDEPLAGQRVRRALSGLDNLGPLIEAHDAATALRVISTEGPDILLLDVRMPGMNGLQLLKELPDPRSPTILITAHDQFAVEAFDLNIVDYILKPFDTARLLEAIGKAQRLLSVRHAATTQPAPTAQSDDGDPDLWVRVGSERRCITPEQVLRFEAEGDFVRLHTPAGSHLFNESLGSLERRLDKRMFLRIHRTTIVNRNRLQAFRRGRFGSLHAVFEDGMALRVGRTYEKRIRLLLLPQASRTTGSGAI